MPVIRFENVSKHFGEDTYGLRDITFVVDPGEFMFVTGQSGSGKTTLLRLLLKEYSLSEGEIYFNDLPLSEIKMNQVHHHRRKIGMVFQDYKLIPEMNIWENIALPLSVLGKSLEEIEHRVTDLLNLIHLPEKALHFPSQLSGGEAQRVGIARALAVGPELVIADEPTGNLDPETALGIARLLKKINELGTTVVIATHDKNIIAQYPETRVLVLDKGSLIKDTDPRSKVAVAVHVVSLDGDEKVSTDEDKSESHERKDSTGKTPKVAQKKKTAESKETDQEAEQKVSETPADSKPGTPPHTEENHLTAEPVVVTEITISEEPAEKKQSWWKKLFSKKMPSNKAASQPTEKYPPELTEAAPTQENHEKPTKAAQSSDSEEEKEDKNESQDNTKKSDHHKKQVKHAKKE